jgi:hypothetical protein
LATRCARDVLAGTGFGADIWAAADRGEITDDQASLVVRALLLAGVDTTVNGIGANEGGDRDATSVGLMSNVAAIAVSRSRRRAARECRQRL